MQYTTHGKAVFSGLGFDSKTYALRSHRPCRLLRGATPGPKGGKTTPSKDDGLELKYSDVCIKEQI